MHCPNYHSCQLIRQPGLIENESLRNKYTSDFCTEAEEHWKNCMRFRTTNILHFCPDFVLPDTSLSIDEIMDRFDNEISQQNYTDR